jgi:hypothetical protein
LRSNDFSVTPLLWRKNIVTVGATSAAVRSFFCNSSSPIIRNSAVVPCRANYVSFGNGSRLTVRCATWCVVDCCYCSIAPVRLSCPPLSVFRAIGPKAGNPRSTGARQPARARPLRELLPLEVRQVRRSAQEPLFDSLIEQYHYLRYQQPVGEHVKYLVSVKGQAIACLAWCSAPRHLASRDHFIGWSAEARKRNLHLLA